MIYTLPLSWQFHFKESILQKECQRVMYNDVHCSIIYFWPCCGLQNLSSLTSDWICALCSGSVETQPLDGQGIPCSTFVFFQAVLSSHCSLQASLVAAHGLSCPMACGISVPGPEIHPSSPALEGRFLTTGPPGKSPVLFLIVKKNWHQGKFLIERMIHTFIVI